MRLIDANALIAEQCGQCDGACEMFDVEKCLACKSDFRCDLREAIDNAPTLDYAPVRHGEWKFFMLNRGDRQYVDSDLTCSKCSHRFVRLKGMQIFNYCPNCGAKMDAKEDAHG